MQLQITKIVHTQLTDEGRWENAPYFPWLMEIVTRDTGSDQTDGESDITDGDQSITRLN